MATLRHFGAPWGTPLRLVTGFTSGLSVLMVVVGLGLATLPAAARLLLVLLPPLGLAAGALFSIRGFELTTDAILVLRPGWRTRIDLAGLQQATVDPEATRRSLRSCGNGGFFSFTGWYANKRLGSYRLFGTDLQRSVVLRFANRRVVVTPAEPEAFVRLVKEQAGLP